MMIEQGGNVEGRLSLYELIYRYALYIDTHEIDKWVDLFAPDAAFDERAFSNPLFNGHDEIRAYGHHLVETGTQMIHHMTNIILDDMTDHTANGTVFAMVETRRDNGAHARHHVIYKDSYTKLNGRWLIAERVLHQAFPSEIVSPGT